MFGGSAQGHSAPIVGIEVLGASSNQVVSADSEGVVKTWDLGTYQQFGSMSNWCFFPTIFAPFVWVVIFDHFFKQGFDPTEYIWICYCPENLEIFWSNFGQLGLQSERCVAIRDQRLK